MNVTDPVSDMLTRIRNAGNAHHSVVRIPGSKMKLSIAKILKGEGYIEDFKFVEDTKQGEIEITLRYDEFGDPIIRGIKRISKPGLRMYVNKDKVPFVLNGYGIAILTTSNGLITDRAARKKGIGGEVVCYVW
jgi:small subunit ribosomal protein S8